MVTFTIPAHTNNVAFDAIGEDLDRSICTQGMQMAKVLLQELVKNTAGGMHPDMKVYFENTIKRFLDTAELCEQVCNPDGMVELVEQIRAFKPMKVPNERKIFEDKYGNLRSRLKFNLNGKVGGKRDTEYEEKVTNFMTGLLTKAYNAHSCGDQVQLDKVMKELEDYKYPARTK